MYSLEEIHTLWVFLSCVFSCFRNGVRSRHSGYLRSLNRRRFTSKLVMPRRFHFSNRDDTTAINAPKAIKPMTITTGIHSGDSTQSHAQAITPHSFRVINRRASRIVKFKLIDVLLMVILALALSCSTPELSAPCLQEEEDFREESHLQEDKIL